MRTFDIHGVGMEVSSRGEQGGRLLEWIAEDFSHFEVDRLRTAPELVFAIGADPSEARRALQKLAPAFRTKMCRAYGWGGLRICDYGGDVYVSAASQGRRRVVELAYGGTSSQDLAYEALYGAVLSALGEQLDRRGFHRVHALGLARELGGGKQRSVLVLLPSGGGKSAIAALLMSHPSQPEIRIYSDESPLLHEGRIHPFPIRGALRPEVAQALGVQHRGTRIFRRKHYAEKLLLPFESGRVARPASPDWILVGRAGDPRRGLSRILPEGSARLAAMAGLLDTSVVGRGLAQMSEYMIRGDSLWNLPTLAWSRLDSVRKLLREASFGWLEQSSDARQSAESVLELLV